MWHRLKLMGATLMYFAACAFAILLALTGYWGAEHYQIEPTGMRNIVKSLAIFVFVDNLVDGIKVLRLLIEDYLAGKEQKEDEAEKANEGKEKGWH